MSAEMSTPIESAVLASPRSAWLIQTTYEPSSYFWPPNEVSRSSSSTSIPFASSQRTRRLASASLRWPLPNGMTWAFGYSVIQLLATSNGAGQHEGRSAFLTPRR